jgi:hypothetical protein
MSKSVKPDNPLNRAVITGVTRRVLPETLENQRKEAAVPGARQGAFPLNQNEETRKRVQEWLERRGKKAK